MCKIYGYVRVSTREQNEDRQMIALHEQLVPEKKYLYRQTVRKGLSKTSVQEDGKTNEKA